MPTGNIVSHLWFIRITLPHVAIIELLNKYGLQFMDHKRHLVVSHVGQKTEKEHVHCLIELLEPLQKQSVDKRYKKVFGVSGADYSSKPWDGDMGAGAGSYVFHDPTAKVLKQKGFTDEELDTFRRLNADVAKVVEINKQRASGRCVDRVLQQIATSDRIWSRKEIATRLLTDIKEGVMYEPGDYVLRRYIEEIYGKQLTGHYWEQYVAIRVANLITDYDAEISFPLN